MFTGEQNIFRSGIAQFRLYVPQEHWEHVLRAQLYLLTCHDQVKCRDKSSTPVKFQSVLLGLFSKGDFMPLCPTPSSETLDSFRANKNSLKSRQHQSIMQSLCKGLEKALLKEMAYIQLSLYITAYAVFLLGQCSVLQCTADGRGRSRSIILLLEK